MRHVVYGVAASRSGPRAVAAIGAKTLPTEKRSGVRRLYVPDPLGSTRGLIDPTQNQTDTFAFWPYGEIEARTGSTPTPFQFVGTLGYHLDLSGLVYVRARYLDVVRGRWVTRDPMGRRLAVASRPYRYAEGDPVAWADPLGLWCIKIFGVCIGNTCNTRKDCPPKAPPQPPHPKPPAPPPPMPPPAPPPAPAPPPPPPCPPNPCGPWYGFSRNCGNCCEATLQNGAGVTPVDCTDCCEELWQHYFDDTMPLNKDKWVHACELSWNAGKPPPLPRGYGSAP